MGIVVKRNYTQPPISAEYNGDGRNLRQLVGASFALNLFNILKTGEGNPGEKGWSPVFSIVTRNDDRVLRLIDYVNGQGIKPTIPANNYIGANGFTDLNNAINIRGLQGQAGIGIPGAPGAPGANAPTVSDISYDPGSNSLLFQFSNGSQIFVGLPDLTPYNAWAPVLAMELVSNEVYLKVIDFIGGEGTKPEIPSPNYIGLSGYVAVGSAINIKGIQGDSITGPEGPEGPNVFIAQELPTLNLNEQKTAGSYGFIEADLTNGPHEGMSGHSGILKVITYNNVILQELSYASAFNFYARLSTDNGSTWTNWKNL